MARYTLPSILTSGQQMSGYMPQRKKKESQVRTGVNARGAFTPYASGGRSMQSVGRLGDLTQRPGAFSMTRVSRLGSSGPSEADKLRDEYEASEEEARAANEARYAQILSGYQGRQKDIGEELGGIVGGYEDRYSTAMDTLKGMGEQEKQDIQEQHRAMASSYQQDAVSRGLGGALSPSIQRGMQRDQTSALGRLSERLRTQQVGYQTGLQGDTLAARERKTGQESGSYKEMMDFMERREDEYPDYQEMARLMQGLGQAGGQAGSMPLVNQPAIKQGGLNPASSMFLRMSGRYPTTKKKKKSRPPAQPGTKWVKKGGQWVLVAA